MGRPRHDLEKESQTEGTARTTSLRQSLLVLLKEHHLCVNQLEHRASSPGEVTEELEVNDVQRLKVLPFL